MSFIFVLLFAALIAQVGFLFFAWLGRNLFAGLLGGLVSFIAVAGIGALV